MDLLEAILALTKSSGERNLQRRTLYKAVARVVQRLMQWLRQGDEVHFQGRWYFLVDEKGGSRYIAVNTHQGSASLGVPGDIPLASYEEHVFFSNHAAAIVEKFAELLRNDVKRMQSIERELSEVTERKLNAS